MHFGEPLPDERFLDLVHLAYEKGIRTFFTADVYGTGEADSLLQRGDLGAPACNDCHGNHGPAPPGVARVSRSCSLCHSANARRFDGSKHKQAFDEHGWAECSKCHGNHAIAKTNDAMLATKPGSLCGDCHRQYAKNEPAWIFAASICCVALSYYVLQLILLRRASRTQAANQSF